MNAPNLSDKKIRKLYSKQTKAAAWNGLRRVMESVHQKNRGASEAEVCADIQRAVTELRQEEYVKKTRCCSG